MKLLENKMEKEQKLLPFDLYKYINEKRELCTREGNKVRILCTNLNKPFYKIAAAITIDKEEYIRIYTEYGFKSKEKYKNNEDLMMLPIKRKGWINIYKTSIKIDKKSSEEKEKTLNFYYNRTDVKIYNTEEEAKINVIKKEDYIDTIKIEWEE